MKNLIIILEVNTVFHKSREDNIPRYVQDFNENPGKIITSYYMERLTINSHGWYLISALLYNIRIIQ